MSTDSESTNSTKPQKKSLKKIAGNTFKKLFTKKKDKLSLEKTKKKIAKAEKQEPVKLLSVDNYGFGAGPSGRNRLTMKKPKNTIPKEVSIDQAVKKAEIAKVIEPEHVVVKNTAKKNIVKKNIVKKNIVKKNISVQTDRVLSNPGEKAMKIWKKAVDDRKNGKKASLAVKEQTGATVSRNESLLDTTEKVPKTVSYGISPFDNKKGKIYETQEVSMVIPKDPPRKPPRANIAKENRSIKIKPSKANQNIAHRTL